MVLQYLPALVSFCPTSHFGSTAKVKCFANVMGSLLIGDKDRQHLCERRLQLLTGRIMFQSRITSKEYHKSVQHEDVAGEDVSLDDIHITFDLEEEEVKTTEENIFESRVSINMNPSFITIPDDFKDDKSNLVKGDDVEENQKNNTAFASEHLRDTLTTMPTLAKNNEAYIKDLNSLQEVNKSYTTQIGKKHINVTNRMENSTSCMPQPHNFVNQVDDQNTSIGKNMNTSYCSNLKATGHHSMA
ncbi:hypothetical protein Cgig2_000381 [Carnegiea gigantea]|uniref:Uncharacterized protein n=1 Tax=Carnegiea gigantea TaxID=171969 RepID=A0A9Q1JFT5_9CARY|nr:hypothetical protein Cgig2_000381 [Carnegiea gigantea]